MASRFASLRTSGGAGYDTTGKDQFDSEVTFILDYSDLELGINDARFMLTDFGNEIKASMVGTKTDSSGFVFANSDFKNSYTATGVDILLPNTKGIGKDAYEIGKVISDEAKKTIKKYIGSRVDTGLMKGSVYGRTTRTGRRIISRAGWVDLWYKYFGFQENGTSNGIRPMHSMLRTYLELAPEVKKTMSWYLRNITKKTGYKG